MDIQVKQGEDRLIHIYYRNNRNRPLSLIGASVTFVLAKAATPQTPELTLTTTTYIDERDYIERPVDAKGIATVTLTDTVTTGLAAGTYVADAKVVDSTGKDTISQTYTIQVKARRT